MAQWTLSTSALSLPTAVDPTPLGKMKTFLNPDAGSLCHDCWVVLGKPLVAAKVEVTMAARVAKVE